MQTTLALSLECSEIEVGAALRVDHLVAMPSAAFEALPTKKFSMFVFRPTINVERLSKKYLNNSPLSSTF